MDFFQVFDTVCKVVCCRIVVCGKGLHDDYLTCAILSYDKTGDLLLHNKCILKAFNHSETEDFEYS